MTCRSAYSCPFVPAVWIAAHGLVPWRLLPGGQGRGILEQREGLCPYCRSFANTVLTDADIDGIVLATTCDQMRRVFDVVEEYKPGGVFLLNVPATWQSETAMNIYAKELQRCGKWFCKLDGKNPSDQRLVDTMKSYQQRRMELLNNRTRMSGAEFSRKIANLYCQTGQVQYDNVVSGDGVGLAIIGAPLVWDDFEVLRTIESHGGRIVLDATETGERGLCDQFDADRLAENPFDEMVRAYFEGIADAWRRPDEKLFEWFGEQCKARSVRGVILKRYLWCDIWHGQLYRLREMFDGPVLEMDTGELSVPHNHRIMGRIEAFVEAVR